MYRIEDEHSAILQIQNYLLTLSYYDNKIPRVPMDGTFESDTKNAVMAYQKSRNLSTTGRIDKQTFDSLKRECHEIESSHNTLFPADFCLKKDDNNENVELLNLFLHYDDRLHRNRSSYFGKETDQAVKYEQKKRGREQTGTVDNMLMDELLVQYIQKEKEDF